MHYTKVKYFEDRRRLLIVDTWAIIVVSYILKKHIYPSVYRCHSNFQSERVALSGQNYLLYGFTKNSINTVF